MKSLNMKALWNELPPSSHKAWKSKPGKECLELLCGVLWNLDLAEQIGGGFSKELMGKLLGEGNENPWIRWISKKPELTAEFSDKQLNLKFFYDDIIDEPDSNLLQSMLLANAALRLAGVLDILKTKSKFCGLILPKKAEDFKLILDTTTGNFLKSPSSFNKQENLFENILIVLAFRDSFMHGETSDKKDIRRKFRDLWLNGNLKHTYLGYNLATIGLACKEVWKVLANCIKKIK